ncbi:Integral membrane protein TerC family protein [Anaplasma phagocytophilum]|uniref:TerC family protein n=1 Tax=Anaplasma phagocytophilum TaxID=948 RepID=UPI0007E01658|nr:TerC family protein [Anaplasma phagocytophilum]SCV61985.1 Integral membrane protein TerC family protein [Anaplasma phagocytophilum]SCV64188.1 Integral membrane protein TerC family protein [Anaplasma phagocytophilum]
MYVIYNCISEFLTLLMLEIILGIDNLIFISIICEKLPINIRDKARICGIFIALGMRFLMLYGASLVLSINEQVISILNITLSYRDMFMIAGGAFLIYKSAKEIYSEVFPEDLQEIRTYSGILWATLQIVGIDIMLSLDSVISAVGITSRTYLIWIVFVIYAVMALFLSKSFSNTIRKFGNCKIIALLFIGMLGIILLLDGFKISIPHEYLYTTLVFSLAVEAIQLLKQRFNSKIEE